MKKNNFLLFMIGFVAGSVITYIYLNKNKQEHECDFENEDKELTQEEKDMYMKNYKSHLRYYRCDDEKGDESEVIKPYIITPEEFGENDDYEQISMTYYSDKILADDGDNVVDDIEDTVGIDALTCFGEYEDDSVFVRNDILKCDYEILLDSRKYTDVLKEMPYLNRR